MNKSENTKVALVHDFLIQYGGAERVLEVLCEMFPQAPVYALLHEPEKMRGRFADREIHTSFLQKFPKFIRKRYKWLLPLMPVAPETFDLRDYDLIISSSGAWAKGIVTRLNSIHIAYLHSPMRFVWDVNEEYLIQQKKIFPVRFLIRRFLNYIRVWDKVAADRPDHIISNSEYTKSRVKKYYGRESKVIYPPVILPSSVRQNFQKNLGGHLLPGKGEGDKKNYFLVVSRLSPYKKIDVVVETFNKLELPLVVVGEGEQEKYLKKIAGKNVKILGWQSDDKVGEIYQKARAFIFPSIDDFGIAPVEAMGRGIPVLTIKGGGIKEIMIEGKTGEFFDTATPEVIADGVRRFMENEEKYVREVIIGRAKKFSKDRFISELEKYIENIIPNFKYQMSNQIQNSND